MDADRLRARGRLHPPDGAVARRTSRHERRRSFSPARFWAMVVKEFVQMRRDRLTFGMMVGIPLLQLVLFGYAINSDPKHLPAAVLLADHGPQGRTLLNAIQQQQLLRLRRRVRQTRRRAHEAAGARRGAVRRQHPGELHPRPPARRPAGAPGRGRRDRPGRDQQRPRARSAPCSITALPQRPQRAARFSRAPPTARSSCAFTRSTTPRRSRNTTSCPG